MILENDSTHDCYFCRPCLSKHDDLAPINHCHTPIDEALALTIYSAAEGGCCWVVTQRAVLHHSLSLHRRVIINSEQTAVTSEKSRQLLLNVNLIQVLNSILHIPGRLIHVFAQKKEEE